MPRLSERAFIHEIEALASRWRDDHGKAPVNVSHWNPSDEFLGRLQRHLAPSLFDPLAHVQACDPVPYRYSQGLPVRAAMLAKLGFSSDRVYALITENGTSSISTVANWLKLMGVAEVVLLAPYYYATLHSLRRLGIAVRQVPLERTADGAYRLPALAELDLRPRPSPIRHRPVRRERRVPYGGLRRTDVRGTHRRACRGNGRARRVRLWLMSFRIKLRAPVPCDQVKSRRRRPTRFSFEIPVRRCSKQFVCSRIPTSGGPCQLHRGEVAHIGRAIVPAGDEPKPM